MIYCLTGILVEKTATTAVISCGGVGYLANIPTSSLGALPAIGKETTLYTSMHVSENDVALYGFADIESKAMFEMLTSVSGVGPKVGLAILSALQCRQIALALSASDFKTLTAANGVGPKLAQRIVLELKDKITKGTKTPISLEDLNINSGENSSGTAQAMAALTGLGYSGAQAAAALRDVDDSLPTAEIIRLALQSIGKGK